eukprot:SAG11_NODE_33954_length_274_cov_1.171429_1_plen_78_part_01
MTQRLTTAVYRTVCRSLFQSDILLFMFLLGHTLSNAETQPEWDIFKATVERTHSNETPGPSWIAANAWQGVLQLSTLP